MRLPVLQVLVVGALASLAGPAHAHLDLLTPPPRTKMLKQGPCGAGPDDPRGPTVATYKPGETITITWNEYVDHPGHYRVALDEDGQDGFFEPAAFDDQSGGPGVLMDGIADKNGGDYSQEITLPNVECDNCVLQVIQMMTDKPPYGNGDDLYYQCADIAIVGDVMATTGEPDMTTGEPATTTDTPDPTTGEPATTGATTAASDTSAGESSPHGEGGSEGGTAGLTGGDAPTTSTGDASATAGATDTATTDGGDGDSGCGCNSGAGGAGWLALGLLPLLPRRRRR